MTIFYFPIYQVGEAIVEYVLPLFEQVVEDGLRYIQTKTVQAIHQVTSLSSCLFFYLYYLSARSLRRLGFNLSCIEALKMCLYSLSPGDYMEVNRL